MCAVPTEYSTLRRRGRSELSSYPPELQLTERTRRGPEKSRGTWRKDREEKERQGASQWGQGNNEKRGNMEWRWKSRMKKSVSCTLETTKEERCLRHARATTMVTANSRLLNSMSFYEIATNARRIRGTRILVRHFWLPQEGRFN